MKILDSQVIRILLKAVSLSAIGVSGLLIQTSPLASIILLALSVGLGVIDYIASQRISSLFVERITGILEAAFFSGNFEEDDAARITVYIPCISKKDTLKQLGKYYPTEKYSSFRKGISTSKGIVGYCFRNRQRYLEVLEKEDDFKKHMMKKWGFTEDETDRMKTKKSFFAVPVLGQGGKALGVVYLDSLKEDAFPSETVDNITRACIPLARWMAQKNG
jgi:hypothetical protein